MKKGLIIGVVIAIIVFLGALVLLLIKLGIFQSFFVPGGIQHMQYSLIQETPEYYVYHISWDALYPELSSCEGQSPEASFSFTTSHNVLSAPLTLKVIDHYETFNAGDMPYLPFQGNVYGLTPVPSGTNFGTGPLFNATNIQLNGVTAVASCNMNNATSVPFTYTKLQVQCMMQKEDTGYIFCTWSGTAKSDIGSDIILRGLNSGSADVKMYKVGYPESQVSNTSINNSNSSLSSNTSASQNNSNQPSISAFQRFINSIINFFRNLFTSR